MSVTCLMLVLCLMSVSYLMLVSCLMSVSCVQTDSQADSQEESQSSEDSETVSGPDYNYLLNMMLWYLTKEKKDELLKQRDAKAKELTKLRKMTPPDLWREDLRAFLEELDVSAVST